MENLSEVLNREMIIILLAMVFVAAILGYGFYTVLFKKTEKIDPSLKQIALQLLQEHMNLMQTGEFKSNDNINQSLVPLLKQKAEEFKEIIESGVEVESKIENPDNLWFEVVRSGEKDLKIKVHGKFIQSYYFNGTEIMNPGDPTSIADESAGFEDGAYEMKFEKLPGRKYALIGINDSIMGNPLGQL